MSLHHFLSPVFVADPLCKRYDTQVALADVTLSVSAGHVVGLLGRNGADKTTLMHLTASLILPTSGSARTLGQSTHLLATSELSRFGLVVQEARFVEWMRVAQHLDFTASFYPSGIVICKETLSNY